MKKVVLSSLFFLMAFITIVLMKMPASFVLSHAAKQSNMLYLDTIQGTIWQGSAQNVQLKLPAGLVGRRPKVLHLGAVQWDLSFWQLLSTTAALTLETQHSNQSLKTEMAFGLLDHSLELGETWFEIQLPFAMTFYPVPAKIQGKAELNLQKLSLEMIDNMPVVNDIEGQVLVSGLEVKVTAPVVLGDFGVNVFIDDQDLINATLSDVNATVGVSGKATYNQATKAYSANGEVQPTPKTNPMVLQALNYMAVKQANGSYAVSQSGSL